MKYTIGLDFGTDSVRALVVNVDTGKEVGTAVSNYPRWEKEQYCVPYENQYRQHPLDYIESMTEAVKNALCQAGEGVKEEVIGIGVDTTGSTPCPVNGDGIPLALTPEFETNPNAMFHLWKDHTAIQEADEINQANEKSGENYLKYVGGIYSSEWYWAKVLHTSRKDEAVRKAAFTWIEHCDWIPFLLTGGNDATTVKRSVCASGHKALWHKEYGGIPFKQFIRLLDPLFEDFKYQLLNDVAESDQSVGTISQEWANSFGLTENVQVAVGAFDCHMGAVGGEIEEGYLSKVIGTSTCDIMVVADSEKENLVGGICGQVKGSVIPGMFGLEAGQSAFGDIYAWFKRLLSFPLQLLDTADKTALQDKIEEQIIPKLSQMAAAIEPAVDDMVSLDWHNGRRTPDANQHLKGALSGINLGTDAPRVFKSLVESTCFGARSIAERFESEGVPIKGVIALGGISQKSPYVMQTMSDVFNRPIRVNASEQTCALGAAMFAATVAGAFKTVHDAMKSMGQGDLCAYTPNPERVKIYDELYKKYVRLGQLIEDNTIV